MPLPVTIHGLSLSNFRNAETAQYTFSDGLIFVTGNNGAGKTTILEALGLASFLKSFRFALDREMVRFGASFYRIEVSFSVGSENHGSTEFIPSTSTPLSVDSGEGLTNHRIAIAYGRNPDDPKGALSKRYSFDGRTNEKAAHIIGRIPAVVLSPDDMRIIAGDHSERRRFLDLLLSMLYPAYFSALQHYHRALKMRSQLLKTRPDESVLSAIDRELASSGVQILEKRRQFIPEFAAPFAANVAKISSEKDAWQIVYEGDTQKVNTVDDYMQMLRDHRANDLRLRQTTSGIHRDRVFFLADGNAEREIRNVGSQGQKRTAALALKMAQFTYMQGKLGRRPVLLIDDVLNELDLLRRASFIDFLGSATGQVFFTTTDLVGMQDFLKDLGQSAAVQNIEL